MTRRNGFTMVELAIIMVILGIIASMLVPTLIETVKRGKMTEARSTMFAVRDGIIGYALHQKEMGGKPYLPDSLTKIGNPRDPWRGTIDYFNATNLSTDICLESNTTNTLITAQGDHVRNMAFIVRSHGPDGAPNVALTNSTDASQPGDDLLLYVTLPHLKTLVCNPTPGQANAGQPISMEDFLDSYSMVTRPDIFPSVAVNQQDNTISFGFPRKASDASEYSYGCVWYQGDKGGCQQGNCFLGKGFRAYFTFTTKSVVNNQLADGFTFAVISALTNSKNSCGGLGSTLGYSSTTGFTNSDQGVPPFVNPPKIGAEFDFYRSSAFADPNPDRDHVSLLYWGNHDPSTPMANNDRYWGGDDNHHSPNVGGSDNPPTPPYRSFGTNSRWFDETGTVVYPVRFEISRQDVGGNSGNYTTRFWFNCQNCDDVVNTAPDTITADALLEDTITLPATWHNQMDRVMFGWTQGTGALTQNVTLTNASFYFLK